MPAALVETEPVSGASGAPDLVEVCIIGVVAAVAALGVVAFSLASLGAFTWWASVVPVVAATSAVAWWRRVQLGAVVRQRPRDWWLVVPVLAVAAVMFFPGFRYATSDKDPGIYVLHGMSIAETGAMTIEATDLQRSGVFVVDDVPGGQWRGFGSERDGWLRPSFYHLWPALLAVGFSAVGFGTLMVAVPLLGMLAVLAGFAVARRLGGTTAGLVASAVLATNMMNVWQAKYPTTETLGQVLFLGAVLGCVVALRSGSRTASVCSGTLLTVGFLNRGEGVALVLLSAAMLALVAVFAPRHRVVRAMAFGIVLPLPLAVWQAYGPAAGYSRANGVPSRWIVFALLAVAVAGPLLVRRMIPSVITALRATPVAVRSALRWVVGTALVAGSVVAVRRPLWFGEDYFVRNGERIRSYDEESLWRLSWFFGWPALALALVGALWAVAVRPTRDRVVVGAVSLAFIALFLVQARNSPQLMWWGRRFVPVAVPGLAIFIGLSVPALTACVARVTHLLPDRVVRPVVVAFVLLAVAVGARHSFVLIGHDERAGSLTTVQRVAAVADGAPAVFLWERGTCCSDPSYLFGGALTVVGGVDSALLPDDESLRAGFVRAVSNAAPSAIVYVVSDRDLSGSMGADIELVEVERISGAVPMLEERNDRRPEIITPIVFDMRVFRVDIAR